MTTPTFFGDPLRNARLLLGDIDALIASPGSSDLASITRVVNRGTLELYRAWKWTEAKQLCVEYLHWIRSSVQSDPHDVGSVLINLCRLDAAVGDWDGCVSWLSALSPQEDAHAAICREMMNAAINCRCLDAPKYLSDWSIDVHEVALVKSHTQFLSSGEAASYDRLGTLDTATDAWRHELAILSAASQGATADVSDMAELALSASAGGAGPSPVLALDRSADILLLHGLPVSVVILGDAISRGAVALHAPALGLRGAARVCAAGIEPDGISARLREAEYSSLPRDAARLWRSASSLCSAKADRDFARTKLGALDLRPLPVEEARTTCPDSFSSIDSSWDGLSDDSRETLGVLGDRLTLLIRTLR